MRTTTLFFALLSMSFLSCLKDNSVEKQFKIDVQKIKDYLTEHNLTATELPSGQHYIITQEGTGDHPTSTTTVTVKYKGYLLDGTVFDQTTGSSTATFSLTNLIAAWQEGIPLLKKGGKGTFLAPSDLCYGQNSIGGIPANSVLIFEIELVNF